jgi:hypothetical protein
MTSAVIHNAPTGNCYMHNDMYKGVQKSARRPSISPYGEEHLVILPIYDP